MGFSNVSGCASIYSWEHAEKHFNATPMPRRREWGGNERPLDDTRKHHYRLVQGENFYNVMLYSTTMARYYRPEGNTRVVAYNFDARPTSSQFMWNVTNSGRSKLFETTDGRKLYVPICRKEYAGFGTTLTLVDGKLDVSRSQHRDIGTYVMSDEKKAWLKQARVFMQPFFDLMMLRVSSIRAELTGQRLNRYMGRPGYGTSFYMHNFVELGITDVPFAFEDVDVERLIGMYEMKVTSILQGVAWRDEEVTDEQIAKRAGVNLIKDMSKLHSRKNTKFKPFPQFPEDLPRGFIEA